MQADAAEELPISATVAAYLQQRQPTVEAVLLGKVIAMELKALHQVCERQYAQHILELMTLLLSLSVVTAQSSCSAVLNIRTA